MSYGMSGRTRLVRNNVMDSVEFCSVLSAIVVLLSKVTLAVPAVFLRGK